MSIDIYDQVGVNCYDNEGNLLKSIRIDDEEVLYPDNAYELRPVVDVYGEEVELVEHVVVDWKESASAVMAQVNAALEALGVEVRFVEINSGDDAYHFGSEPL